MLFSKALTLVFVVAAMMVAGTSAGKRDATSSNCTRLTTYNYHYTPTYPLASLDSDKYSTGFTFNFAVRAQSDAHLRLSSTPESQLSPVTLEVVLGGGRNSFSAVRRRPQRAGKDVYNKTPRILSKTEKRYFTLVLKDEVLTVYAFPKTRPILKYEDPPVVDMAYISFGAWDNIAVEWFFDCKDAEAPRPPPWDPVLRWKQNYWAHYDNFNPPILDNRTMVIDASIPLMRINLNRKDGLFTMQGRFNANAKNGLFTMRGRPNVLTGKYQQSARPM